MKCRPNYKDRVQYFWEKSNKNCSLKLSMLKISDSGGYHVKIETTKQKGKEPSESKVTLSVKELGKLCSFTFQVNFYALGINDSQLISLEFIVIISMVFIQILVFQN